jgi:hypothetical protein
MECRARADQARLMAAWRLYKIAHRNLCEL